MERMDSEDFVVTEDNDATVEELSGDHIESREVPAEDDNVIQVTDGEKDMEDQAQKAFSDIQEDIVYDGVINQHEQQAEPNVQSQAGLSAAPLDAFAKRR